MPCPSPGDLPNPGLEPRSPALQAASLQTEPPGKPNRLIFSLFLLNLRCVHFCTIFPPSWLYRASIVYMYANISWVFFFFWWKYSLISFFFPFMLNSITKTFYKNVHGECWEYKVNKMNFLAQMFRVHNLDIFMLILL